MKAINARKLVNTSAFAFAMSVVLSGCGGSGTGVGASNVTNKLAQSYKMTAVTGPEGSTGAEIRMISPNGMIAGEYTLNNKVICFLYKNGIRTDVTPPDKDCSIMSVSDDGVIAGYFTEGNFNRPFTATAAKFTELPIEAGYSEGEVRGIDVSGNTYIGFYGNNIRRAVKQSNGTQTEFTVPDGVNVGIAAVNSKGGLLGFCQLNGLTTPVEFKNGQTIGTPLSINATGLYIRTLNNLGNFVGAETAGGKGVPFVHIDGQHHVLTIGANSNMGYMLGINDGNVAVGAEYGNIVLPTAWSQSDGLIDLTTRCQADPTIKFGVALSIDNHGTIVGSGTYNSKAAGIILTPVTNP